jgi:hypothetical protein
VSFSAAPAVLAAVPGAMPFYNSMLHATPASIKVGEMCSTLLCNIWVRAMMKSVFGWL